MKITMEMSIGAYEIGKQVYTSRMSFSDAKLKINKETGMSVGSAHAFLTIFLAMMNGEVYKRAFNNATNEYLFESIQRDFGDQYLEKALNAAQEHINYYSTLGKGNLTGLQYIVDQKKKKITIG